MPSNKEIETKIKVSNINSLLEILNTPPFSVVKERYFENNWCYDFDDKRLTKKDILLRLRKINNTITITLKGPTYKNKGIKHRKEWEVVVSDGNNIKIIFRNIGLKKIFGYQKYRTVFKYKDSLICLDETPIGNFLELEGKEEEIMEIASLLGYSINDFIPLSYSSLFKIFKKAFNLKCKDMIFQKD